MSPRDQEARTVDVVQTVKLKVVLRQVEGVVLIT